MLNDWTKVAQWLKTVGLVLHRGEAAVQYLLQASPARHATNRGTERCLHRAGTIILAVAVLVDFLETCFAAQNAADGPSVCHFQLAAAVS